MFATKQGVKGETLYGLDIFEQASRTWVFTGYYPETQARKQADRVARQGGRFHLWRDTPQRKAS